MLKALGVSLTNCTYDAMIAAYLLDYKLNDDITLLMNQLDYDISSYEDTYGTEKRRKKVAEEVTEEQIKQKSEFIYETREKLLKEIEDYKETDLFEKVEMPLAFVLADMELTGIRVDHNYLENLKNRIGRENERNGAINLSRSGRYL